MSERRVTFDVQQQAATGLSIRITRTLRIGRERPASRRECRFIAARPERPGVAGRAGEARDQLLAMASGVGLSRWTAGVCLNTHTVNKPREASIHNRKNAKAIMSDPPIRKVALATW
ncbi:hypothetical protein NK8_09340 [Caballeronia sp. NK8]|nr:hypothetical protein NK8_09340 [Caballeronia sp. NK8]